LWPSSTAFTTTVAVEPVVRPNLSVPPSSAKVWVRSPGRLTALDVPLPETRAEKRAAAGGFEDQRAADRNRMGRDSVFAERAPRPRLVVLVRLKEIAQIRVDLISGEVTDAACADVKCLAGGMKASSKI
jgi:hypothetical protein